MKLHDNIMKKNKHEKRKLVYGLTMAIKQTNK